MKSLKDAALHVALGILKDVQVAYPRMGGVDRDCERLSLNCQRRGLGFFSLDLPSLDDMLLAGLRDGRLVLSGPLSHAVSKKIRVPRFLSGLWLRVFDKDGCLKVDADESAIALMRSIFLLGKKLQAECSPDRLKRAVQEYHNVERQMRLPTLKWEEDAFLDPDLLNSIHLRDAVIRGLPLFPERFDLGQDRVLERVQRVADLILSRFAAFNPVDFTSAREEAAQRPGFRHGPGAVADRRGIVNKYEFPRWSAKLDSRFPYRECGTVASDSDSHPANHEVASRLIAVPKTAKGPRLIAAEPTEHQWCQQLTSSYMVDELKKLFGSKFIDFSDQSKSGKMALQASLDERMATVDLSSASDRLSCWVVERVFRKSPDLLSALHAHRTRYIKDDISSETSYIKLRKFASQGAAVTFPVQTLTFLCIAIGCSIRGNVTWGKIRKLADSVRVFGDDIIVPSHGYASMVDTLHYLGLKVNVGKSFGTGRFRESCGVDGYGGYDVTPVKPQQLIDNGPNARQAMLDTANNYFRKGLWHASERVLDLLPRQMRNHLPVVRPDSGITGLTSFSGERADHLKYKWCSNLHHWKSYVWRIKSRTDRTDIGELPRLLQFFTEVPNGNPDWKPGLAGRSKVRDGLGWEPLPL